MATSFTYAPPVLDLAVERYAAWKTWKSKWNDYVVVSKLAEKDEEYKCAMLRYTFTDDTRKIYESLNLTEEEKKNNKTIIEKLEIFAKGIINETIERHTFNQRNQEDGEKFDDFITDVKILSKNCNFCNNCYEGLIRDRIVGGIKDDNVRRKLLSENNLTLIKAENICKANEKAKEGVESFRENQNEELVDAIYNKYRKGSNRTGTNRYNNRRSENNNKDSYKRDTKSNENKTPCKFCCQLHKWGRDNCPAWGKSCNACGKNNHFNRSILCSKSKEINIVEEEEKMGRSSM